jgi:hypothetical protein
MIEFPAGVTVISFLDDHIQNASGINPTQKVQGLLKHELSKGLECVELCLHSTICVFGVVHVTGVNVHELC